MELTESVGEIATTKPRNQAVSQAYSVKEYAIAEDANIGSRVMMEDDHFVRDISLEDTSKGIFGVLDGHGGPDISKYCSKAIPDTFERIYIDYEDDIEKLFQIVFNKVDDQIKMIGGLECGTTACVCFVRKLGSKTIYPKINEDKKEAHIANLGDTRAVFVTNKGVERVTIDHKATDPKEILRIEEVGGKIFNHRVSGQLAVTRALGDLNLKKEGVINIPHYKLVDITEEHKFLIIASDGLWDVVDDENLYALVKDLNNAEEISHLLVKEAKSRGSEDNITVLSKGTTCTKAIQKWEEAHPGETAAESEEIKLVFQIPPIDKLEAAALNNLTKCKKLCISSNANEKMINLPNWRNLEVLSLSRNQIKKIAGLEEVGQTLRELWLSYNIIEKLDGIQPCQKLQVLYIGNNKLKSFDEVDKLKDLPEIANVVFQGNLMYANITVDEGRIQILKRVPTLKNVDGLLITDKYLEKLKD